MMKFHRNKVTANNSNPHKYKTYKKTVYLVEQLAGVANNKTISESISS